MTEWQVIAHFAEGRISSGKAARSLNLTRHEFFDLLRERDIAYLDFTADDLEDGFDAEDQLAVGSEPLWQCQCLKRRVCS